MQRLDAKVVWMFFLKSVFRWALAMFILVPLLYGLVLEIAQNESEAETSIGFPTWLTVVTLILSVVLCFVWSKLRYRFFQFDLLDDAFRKEEGVIHKKYVSIPYDRIQNVDIYRGLLARMLGLSDLHIQTAGNSAMTRRGDNAEGRLPGLSKAVAEQMRDELIRRSRQPRNQGL